MKKLLLLFIMITGCYTPAPLVEWKVTNFYPDQRKKGKWIIEAKTAAGNTDKFSACCPPDSIGSRFQAKPKN